MLQKCAEMEWPLSMCSKIKFSPFLHDTSTTLRAGVLLELALLARDDEACTRLDDSRRAAGTLASAIISINSR